ncbi:MAG: S-layer homology domain-containing protein [Clostridiales bacterium]|jgi:hypothetical protein|nr:S-layer homology domain-containing protein [Clostridiales bacterium]
MKRIYLLFMLTFFTVALSDTAFAQVGDIGFFGGTTEGRKLPKTTELILAEDDDNTDDTFIYKEIILLDGIPTEFEGNMTVSNNLEIGEDETSGTGTIAYNITPSTTAAALGATLNRSITFDVNWRKEGSQIIKDLEVRSWTEDVTTTVGNYSIDESRSHFSVSVIEDHTPGVVYSKGNLSMNAVYTTGEGGEEEEGEGGATSSTTIQSTGSIYSFDTAWSATETHRIDTWVYAPTWQMQYQIRPSIAVNKTLQYSQNEPTAISFKGNYMEVIQNKSSISYDIFVKPNQFYNVPDKGSVSIPSYNSFEQLIAPDTSFLQGHFAEADINRLFSMQVLTGNPRNYRPDQAITRGQFVEALTRAVKLPIDLEEVNQSSRTRMVVNVAFPDVMPERAEYPYIMAAYRAGLAIGRDNGNFYIDSPIERQEAIVILVRTLGLSNLGLDPTPITPFTDDTQIGDWAKKEIYAAQRIGLISGDVNGNIRPADLISKAEGAALVNRMIDYMRYDLVTDYTEHIVNYAY